MDNTIVLIVSYSDGTATKKSIYTAASEVEAVAGFHKYLGQFVGASNVAFVLVMALDTAGNLLRRETWAPETAE